MHTLPRTIPLLLAMTAGCYSSTSADEVSGSTSTTGGEAAAPTPVMPHGTSVFLEVVTRTGAPISRANVTLYLLDLGDPDTGTGPSTKVVERTTDGAGHLLVEDLAPGRFVAKVDASGHAPASVVLELEQDAHAGARAVLQPHGPPIVFQAGQATMLAQGDVRVDIPANAFLTEDGAPVTGLVEARLAPFDPANGLGGLSWPLAGVRSAENGGESLPLKTLYMVDISVWQGDRRLRLAPGKSARLEILLPEVFAGAPLAESYAVGDEIPGWAFDFAGGVWREEAAGRVVASTAAPGRSAWLVDVDNMEPRNIDCHYPRRCINVTVFDKQGDPVEDVNVVVQGTNTLTQGLTAANGQVCLEAETTYTVKVYVGQIDQPISDKYELDVEGAEAHCGDVGCMTLGIFLDDKQPVCTFGEQVVCPYSGDDIDQAGVGICVAGTDFCGVDGQWLGCSGEVLPQDELCDTPAIDENCNGLSDEPPMVGCQCMDGDQTFCYPHPGILQGACTAGTQTCMNGAWGACDGDQGPVAEDCTTLDIDENCDGNSGCGDELWSVGGLGDVDAQRLVDVTMDGMGGVYVAGFHHGTITFDNFTDLVGDATERAFIAKYANGAFQWVVPLGAGWTHELDIAADPNGANLVFAGTQTALLQGLDGNCPAIAGDTPDVVVLLLDGQTSDCLKSVRVVSPGAQVATAIDHSGTGVFVAGVYQGAPDLGGGPLTASPLDRQDAFVAGFDATLVYQWSRALPVGLPIDDARGPAVTATADVVVVAGVFAGAPVYNNDPLIADGPTDLLVTRLSANSGAMQWIERFGNSGDEPGLVSVAAAGASDFVVSGVVHGQATFGADAAPVGVVDENSVFVVRLGPNAEHRWSTARSLVAPPAADGGQSLAVDSAGRVTLFGTKFDNDGDVYKLKLSVQGGIQWEHTYSAPGSQVGAAIAAGPQDRLCAVGSLTADFDFDGQPLPVVQPGDAGDGFLVCFNP